MHARKGKSKKKKNSPGSGVTCMYFVLYGSVDAALGKLESKKAGIYLSLTSFTAVGRLPRSNLVYIGGTCMRKAGYNPSLTCINIRAKHVRGGMYVRGQRAYFLGTKNSQILYFALVIPILGSLLCDDLPNGPVLSCPVYLTSKRGL